MCSRESWRTLFPLFAALCAFTAFADTHVWVGGSSSGGGWNTPSNWTNAQGVAECPSENDTVIFNQWNQTNVVTDADFELFNKMSRVSMSGWSYPLNRGATLVLDVTGDKDINTSINGTGLLIIKGNNRIEFKSINEAGVGAVYSTYGVYKLNAGGIHVEGGTLVLIQSTENNHEYFYNDIDIDEGASVVIPSNKNVTVRCLKGKGTVRQDFAGNTPILSLSTFSTEVSPLPFFYGKITGSLDLRVKGAQALLGTENDFTGQFHSFYHTGLTKKQGTWVKKFGMKGAIASIGVSTKPVDLTYGGNIGYIGDGTPETTDKSFEVDARSNTGLHPQYFDAGTNGNLRLEGTFSLVPYASEYKMRSIVFTGSNAAPCTIAGPYNMNFTGGTPSYNYNVYTRKEGPGVWQFLHNANSTFCGVFDVREGTLRFNTLAETNVVCALGKSTKLTREFTGPWEKGYNSSYAFRVGTKDPNLVQPVFEFNGSEAGTSTTRPMLLTGNATIRANGTLPDAALTFGDVRAESGATTLTLDGTNTAANTLRELQDGDGTVTLVKDGPGTWRLEGNQTFSGDLQVKKGTLVVSHRTVLPYTWFRMKFNNGFDSGNVWYLVELALYDANGVRRNMNLRFVNPSDTWNGTSSVWKPKELLEGEATYQSDGSSYYVYSNNPFTNMFDNAAATYSTCSRALGASPKPQVVMRLADDCPEIVSVDIAQLNNNQTPNAFELFGSRDGVTWTSLVATNDLPKLGGRWHFSSSDTLKVVGGTEPRRLSDGEGLGFDVRAADIDAKSVLENVVAYSVATGATLTTEGDVAPVISKIRIDAASGAGTISGGFRFAPDVAIDVVGAEKGSKITLPHGFGSVSGFSEARWTLTFDGETWIDYHVTVGSDTLTISPRGMLLIVR